MQFPTTLSSAFVLALAVTSASAAPQTAKRQGPGGDTIFALQTFFGARNCTGPGDLEPTFAGVNLCQPIRSIQPSVESIILGAVTPNFPNCEAHYYTNLACTEGDTVGVVGECSDVGHPYVATNVICQ